MDYWKVTSIFLIVFCLAFVSVSTYNNFQMEESYRNFPESEMSFVCDIENKICYDYSSDAGVTMNVEGLFNG